MDLVASCKEKLAYFRIKELKDVLTQLGLAKQGKKQDLMDRILAMLSDEQASKTLIWAKKNSIGKEGVAKIIDDTYRKMGIPGASDLASSGRCGSDVNKVKFKEEVDDSFDMKIRCPCGNSLSTDSLIQCEGPKCHVWQHMSCVIIPEKPMEGAQPERPPQFFCEICRVTRADPFWVTLGHPLLPVKLTTSNLAVPADGANPVQNVEKTFQLTRADRDLLQKAEYEVQAWCMLLNDKVPFRMQWPQYADLQVNGVPVRTINRPGAQLLGTNGRDDGAAIKTCTREGINKIFLSGQDARIFCLGVRIVRRRTVQQVLSLILKKIDAEPLEDALARVRRCIGGGNSMDNADSDSDLEVVAESVTVNLRCPMSGSRMKIAGRFKPCAHMGCFDLETFVELNQRSRKWQCPICLKNYSLEDAIVDLYFNQITNMMRDCGEDVTDIEVKPDGSWRAKNENERLDLVQWHFPDGSLCVPEEKEVKLNLESVKQIKREGASEGHGSLKLGIKKNQNGVWEVSKPEDMRSMSSGNQLEVKYDKNGPKAMPMSSSATGSRGSEDLSVNQDDGGQSHFSASNINKLDSMSLNFDGTYGVASTAPVGNLDVIVLSDSEEENGNLIPPDSVYVNSQANANGISFPMNSEVPEPYPEVPGVGTGGLGLFNPNDDETGMPWSMQSGTPGGPAFELFGGAGVSDTFVGLPHTSGTCSTSMNGYSLAPDAIVATAAQNPYSVNANTSSLVNNPMAFSRDDPSLQIFLPSRPAGTSVQDVLRDQPIMSDGIHTEDWISLSLGGGGGGSSGGQGESAAANGLNVGNQVAPKEGRLESLANTASLLLSMNGDSSQRTTNEKRSEGPFSYPRQPRSVRPRLYLSIDSDSD